MTVITFDTEERSSSFLLVEKRIWRSWHSEKFKKTYQYADKRRTPSPGHDFQNKKRKEVERLAGDQVKVWIKSALGKLQGKYRADVLKFGYRKSGREMGWDFHRSRYYISCWYQHWQLRVKRQKKIAAGHFFSPASFYWSAFVRIWSIFSSK